MFYHPHYTVRVCICDNRTCFLTCFVCDLQSCSFVLLCDNYEKERCLHICSDFRLLLNCLCSCLKRKNKNSEVFLFWKPLSQTGLSAEGARDTREGRGGRDNVKLCKRTESHTLSQFTSSWKLPKFHGCPGVNRKISMNLTGCSGCVHACVCFCT